MINKQERKDKKLEIEKLKEEERYFELTDKYNSYHKSAKNYESLIETGKKYNDISYKIRNLVVYKDLNDLKYSLKKVTAYGALSIGLFMTLLAYTNKKLNETAYLENEEIISEYDKSLEQYAKKFDTNKMSTMEIIMTVMNDIRSNTEYGINPDEADVFNNYRLVLNDTNNIGVCRHMADKFTNIMNMINPEYEAYNLLVYLDTECKTFKPCDIERPLSEQYLESLESNEEEETNDLLFANHMVSVLKPSDADYFLVVDVTNPSIGVMKNGKIYMFNSNDYSFIEYRPLNQFALNNNNSFGNANKELILSNFNNIDIDELNKIYGLDSQNKILKKINKTK